MSAQSIVLLAGRFPSTAMVYNHLRQRFQVARVILEERPSRLRLLLRRTRRLGVSVAAGQLCFSALAAPALAMAGRRRMSEIKTRFGLDETPVPEDAILRVRSVNDAAVVEALRRLAPAAVVVNGTQLIAAEVLAQLRPPLINLHAGITPRYRGTHGGYWALVENDREHCGVSLHLVDRGIDTGGVLAQARIEPGPRDNFATYPLLQVAAALPLLEAVLEQALRGEITPLAVNGASRLWSHPTLAEYLRHRARGVK